jgi:hypothetical protein
MGGDCSSGSVMGGRSGVGLGGSEGGTSGAGAGGLGGLTGSGAGAGVCPAVANASAT